MSCKILLVASGCSVVAEAFTCVLAGITARTASAGAVYRFCAGFHEAAEAVRFFLFRGIENHPTPIQDITMMIAFFGTALLQWFFIFLLGFALLQFGAQSLGTKLLRGAS